MGLRGFYVKVNRIISLCENVQGIKVRAKLTNSHTMENFGPGSGTHNPLFIVLLVKIIDVFVLDFSSRNDPRVSMLPDGAMCNPVVFNFPLYVLGCYSYNSILIYNVQDII